MAEMVLAVSFTSFIIFGAITVSDQINQRQRLNSVLRLLSTSLVVNCYEEIIKQSAKSTNCIQTYLDQAAAEAGAVSTDNQFTVTVYNKSGSVLKQNILLNAGTLTPRADTKFNLSLVSVQFKELLDLNHTITLVEAYERDKNLGLLFRKVFFGTAKTIYAYSVF